MSVIIDRCPFHDAETDVITPSARMSVRAYQIVVWVGLSVGRVLSRPFPAVLDTGHSHNFSIREELLRQWTGCEATAMRRVGTIRMNEQVVILREADVVIYPNVPGQRDELRGEPHLLETSQGIVIARAQDVFATRLPTLGLRCLARSGLRVLIDGATMTLTVATK